VSRHKELLRQAKSRGLRSGDFSELAFHHFFPRWFFRGAERDRQLLRNQNARPETIGLFEEAKRLGIPPASAMPSWSRRAGANTASTRPFWVKSGRIVGKYRKVHLPGHSDHDRKRRFQHLEKRYFEPGNLGFPVWRTLGSVMGMCICNDRRWPETYRVMGLQGVEMVMLGLQHARTIIPATPTSTA